MFDDLNDLYQQVILDHCKKPRNFHELPQADLLRAGTQPALRRPVETLPRDGRRRDQGHQLRRLGLLHLQGVRLAAHRSRQGQDQGRGAEDVRPGPRDGDDRARSNGDVGKLAVFAGVHKFPARVKCAILPGTR